MADVDELFEHVRRKQAFEQLPVSLFAEQEAQGAQRVRLKQREETTSETRKQLSRAELKISSLWFEFVRSLLASNRHETVLEVATTKLRFSGGHSDVYACQPNCAFLWHKVVSRLPRHPPAACRTPSGCPASQWRRRAAERAARWRTHHCAPPPPPRWRRRRSALRGRRTLRPAATTRVRATRPSAKESDYTFMQSESIGFITNRPV